MLFIVVRTRQEKRELCLKWGVESSDEALELELKSTFRITECHVVLTNDKDLAEIVRTKM